MKEEGHTLLEGKLNCRGFSDYPRGGRRWFHFHVIGGRFDSPPAIDIPCSNSKKADYVLRQLIRQFVKGGNGVRSSVWYGYCEIPVQLTTVFVNRKVDHLIA